MALSFWVTEIIEHYQVDEACLEVFFAMPSLQKYEYY